MKVYGFQIGSIGVEFSDRETREKAILLFTKGSCVSISIYAGLRYKNDRGAFSTYERNTEEQSTNCSKCEGVFSSETCTQRTVPRTDYDGIFRGNDEKDTKYLCDACYAKTLKDFEVFKTKKVIENN